MANVINYLTYANTFGEWVIATDALIKENNDLAANNYVKPQGTLILSGDPLSLQVANNAEFNAEVTVRGVGSAVTMQCPVFIPSNGDTTYAPQVYISGETPGGNNGLSLWTDNDVRIDGNLLVRGRAIVSGPSIFNSNTISINANTTNPDYAYISVYRPGESTNAIIRWNEPAHYWDILDVDNLNYYRIHTDRYLSDRTDLFDSSSIASSYAVATIGAAATSTANSFNTDNGVVKPINSVISVVGANGIQTFARPGSGGSTLEVGNRQNLSPGANGVTFAGLTLTGAPLSISSGGTGAVIPSEAAKNILPFGSDTNYVLQVQAPGVYYWGPVSTAAVGPSGTVVLSNTASYTATSGQAQFVTPPYTAGRNQVQVYINGVHQQIGDYSETSSGTSSGLITLSTPATAGDQIYIRVDGYFNNPSFANNIPMTPSTSWPAPYGPNNDIVPDIPGARLYIELGIQKLYNITAKYGRPVNFTTAAIDSLGVGTAATGTTGEIVATNQITAYYSDERLKTKLGNIENALGKVKQLSGFYYEANELAQELGYEKKREVGVSYQEFDKVLPEVTAPAPIDPQYGTVRYERISALLIEAIKELSDQVDEIKEQLKCR